jgi:hypothetical protein
VNAYAVIIEALQRFWSQLKVGVDVRRGRKVWVLERLKYRVSAVGFDDCNRRRAEALSSITVAPLRAFITS